MKPCAALFLLLVALLAAAPVWAGGGGLNVIVVVNQNSPDSLELGNDYCRLRGVPPQNLLRLTHWTGGSINWSPGQFTNFLLNPLLAMIAGRGLTSQAQVVLLSMDIPYRVTDGNNVNSTTSALFYGFKTNGLPVPVCALPDESSNSYAYSELPFNQSPPNTAPTQSFLAMMLTGPNLEVAENILRRSAASDGSFPTQTVFLAKTTDENRNVRFVEFDNAVFENQVAGNYAVTRTNTDATGFTNLFGLQTGLAGFPLAADEFVPGALGDTLTSYGGYILDSQGQTVLLAFLEAGAAGSYGTVVEPCNYTEKFPDPVDYFYQTRGFALAEAYYQSVLNPYEGLMVGEPLAAPFARPGGADWSSLTNGAVLSGQFPLSVVFTAAATNLPLMQVDLFVDGTFFETLTNVPPTPGNVLSVTLNGSPITYTVQPTDTLATAAAGLAAALNQQAGATQLQACPVGDRIELQSQALYVPGSNITVSVGADRGSAPVLTTGLAAARPVFLDTVATGFLYVAVQNAPAPGDWLQLNIVKTNGVSVTLGVTNTSGGDTVGTLVQNLVNLINATPALQSADGVLAADFADYESPPPTAQFFLYARTPGLLAAQIMVTLTTTADFLTTSTNAGPLADNLSDLWPRNHLYLSSGLGSLPVNATGDTTPWPDGWHQLTAVAYEGTSVRTQTRVGRRVQIQNTGLTATLTVLPPGTNLTLNQPLQFAVTASPTNLARVELFGTGGSLGFVTNQPAAGFSVNPANLGVGRHPFYALVTDQAGDRYQTATVWLNLVPPITLTLGGEPPLLAWPAAHGCRYSVGFTTNLTAGFQTVATLTATNYSGIQWPVTLAGLAGFYQVQLDP